MTRPLRAVPAPARPLLTRDELDDATRSARRTRGWFVASAEGGLALPLDPEERREIRDITAENLVSIGIDDADGVVVALNSDGAGVGVVWSEAASEVAHRSCAIGVRGGTRLTSILESFGATVLVGTPTFVRNLGVRMRQIGGDPQDFGLRMIVLTGEILLESQRFEIEEMYDVDVAEVWSDPVFGAALAHRAAGDPGFSPVRRDLLSLARVGVRADRPDPHATLHEWVVDPLWCEALEGARIRTGFVGIGGSPLPPPVHTIGDHVLLRGRWLSHGHLAGVLEDMDLERWELEIETGIGGDVATLHHEGDHDAEQVRAATALVSAVRIQTLAAEAGSIDEPGRIIDRRGQHLGDRIGDS